MTRSNLIVVACDRCGAEETVSAGWQPLGWFEVEVRYTSSATPPKKGHVGTLSHVQERFDLCPACRTDFLPRLKVVEP